MSLTRMPYLGQKRCKMYNKSYQYYQYDSVHNDTLIIKDLRKVNAKVNKT